MHDARMGPIGTSRKERIATGESVPARGFLGVLAAGAREIVRLDVGATQRFTPYDHLIITNNSDERITVRLNGGEQITFTVLGRQERESKDSNFHFFSVTNDDGARATSANEIEFIAQHVLKESGSLIRDLIRKVR